MDSLDIAEKAFRKDEMLFYKFLGISYGVHSVITVVLFTVMSSN